MTFFLFLFIVALLSATTIPNYSNVEAFVSSTTTSTFQGSLILVLPSSTETTRRKYTSHLFSISPEVAKSDTAQEGYGQDETTNVLHSTRKGAIDMTVDELALHLGGWGRAKLVWDYYRIGVDPLKYYSRYLDDNDGGIDTTETSNVNDSLARFVRHVESQEEEDKAIRNLLPTSRKSQPLGRGALEKLKNLYSEYGGSLEGGVARLSHVSKSKDGTTKLLIALKDGLEVETVIIPWFDKGWSTICISSQVGCRQGCTFCSTGRMGRQRNLSSTEILAQFFFALKICRLGSIPALANVVFMGMGEPADNAEEVNQALDILTNVDLFHMGQTKVTVSTVAPTPQAFSYFVDSPCALAWSVHAANDDLRRKLVPTTKYSMAELRQGLIDTLLARPRRLRATMLEVALIDGVNDSDEAAQELADFIHVILESVPGIKLVCNLIPFNDIGHPSFRQPSMEKVKRFQRILWDNKVYSHVRTTRGDDESAACGQLATKKSKVTSSSSTEVLESRERADDGCES